MTNGREGYSNVDASVQNQNDDAMTHTKRHHSRQQIQELEAFFEEIPKPTDKQRREIAVAIKMDPEKVKFWFQNKRSQLKAKSERQANYDLKIENNLLHTENAICKDALNKLVCAKCGGACVHNIPLKMENIKLRNEIKRVQNFCLRMERASMNLPETSNATQLDHASASQEHHFFFP